MGGAAGQWVVFVVVTETVWEIAAAGESGTADRSSAGEEETDGGIKFAASVALEPCVFVVKVLEAAGWIGSLHLCNGKGLPQANWQGFGMSGGSVVPQETNLVEPPVWNIVIITEAMLHQNNCIKVILVLFVASKL